VQPVSTTNATAQRISPAAASDFDDSSAYKPNASPSEAAYNPQPAVKAVRSQSGGIAASLPAPAEARSEGDDRQALLQKA